MSKIILLFLSFSFVSLDGEIYKDRPKIKTDNGDLILEPAFDKNIYLRPNGPQSAVYVGDINILNVNSTQIISDELATNNQTPITLRRILERLEKLEKQVNVMDPTLNLTLIWQKINRQATVIHRLRNAIRDGVTGDKCEPRPCQNGGTCLSLVNDYHCLCPSNWEGKDCNLDVNECRNFAGTDLGCQNGATCINRPGSYECLCRTGWFGLHCTRKAKDCLGSGGGGDDFEMCGHGTCIPVQTGVGIKCICDQGWTANGTDVSCSTDINECESKQGPHCSVNPKVNCINLPGSFRCEACPAGYEGDGYVCSDIDECTTTPNGGCSTSPMVSCHNTIGSRTCGHCPPGYVGDGVTCAWRGTCKINHGGCHPSAQCFESPAQTGGQIAQCVCPVGMEGDGVGIDGCYISPSSNITQNCESNPCGPHGRCHQLTQGYTCLCMRGYGGAHCNAIIEFCSSNPCQNGGVCRPDETKIRGFRCECTARFSGDVCHIPTKTCGGFLDGQEGSITYPLTNSSYSHNSRCAWVIHTSSLKVINVTFTKFDIEDNPDCSYDFLQIHDGRSSASQLLGRFCGKSFPKGGNIISSHNYLYFWFRSDESGARTGFSLHWTSIDPVCGGELDANTHGHISSPGSPGKYPPNRDCYWHITTSLGKRIQLHFFEFDIEAHKNCSFDYVAIYDGEHITDPLINKYCNSSQPAPIQSAGSEILIHFHSDGIGSGNGFQISYATVEGVPGCGGLYTGEKGEISSPTYEGKYMDNLLCDYEIKAPPGSKILVRFKSFKLETSFQCKYDYLKMYDGPNTDSQLVGRFCGVRHPEIYTSSSNSILIQFKSDHSLNSDGFHITYEIICQHYITGDSGIIKSPGYPFNYTENKVCEYIVSTAPGKAIQLTFIDFDIEDNKYFNCQYDYVELRDGPDKNSTLMGRFCGSEPPQVQTSSLNYMYIRFNSDMSVSGTGFYANFTSIDVKCGGIHKDATGLISHPIESANTYEKDQTCTWYLIAPPGQRIKLTWNRFEIEGTPSCHSDYLELTEIDLDNTEHPMPKFCGSSAPPTMTTASNRLKINFRSDSSVESAGFSMSYTFLDEKSHCGGIFFRSHGYIYSPGWPQRYEPNRNCVWTITAPFGQQIKLTFSRFNLERPIRNSCDLGDYLEIRNGAADNSPLVGSYCGDNAPKMITSTGNSIYLKFHSDFYFSGAGFQIEWDGTLFGCGGTLTGSKGSITSPNYPLPYNENAECFYRIITSHGSRLKLIFNDLDLEKTHGCTDDYVEIFDGRDSNALSLGRYCSMTLNSSNIETSGNFAYIKFRSDFIISSKGFSLNYHTICHNNVTGSYGIIESPDFPNFYPLNLHCMWTITVPLGNTINVTFSDFDISSNLFHDWRYSTFTTSEPFMFSRLCRHDYLDVKDPSDIHNMKRLCGSSIPAKISTKSNSLSIEFISSSFITRKGFRLEWVKNGCGGHIQKSYGVINFEAPQTSTGPMVCDWIVETATGTGVTISFSNVYMSDKVNCSEDSIEVYNGPTADSPMIMKNCHQAFAMAEASTTNMILLRFSKYSNLRDVKFQSHFSSKPWTGCGGTIISHFGSISSINFPKNYDNNMDCMWTLEVPINHRVDFSIIDLDLYFDEEDSHVGENSCGDSIKLYDGVLFTSNYTHIICGNSDIRNFTSKSNILRVQFTSDGSGTAKGFKANFAVACGALISAKYSGTIRNDNVVSHSDQNCTWTIAAERPDEKISLTLTHLSIPVSNEIQSNRHCSSTFLRILDGDDINAPKIDEYCGIKIPPMLVSHGSAITVQLGSYVGLVSGKFSAHYTTVETACGGELTSEQGSIATPNYPASYPAHTNCEWILKTSPGNRVYITFEKFNIEYSEGCNKDYLEVRENNGGGPLLGIYCGDEIPTNVTVASVMYIKFHSDGEDTTRGFLLHYEFLHGNDITGMDHGEIASPLFPNSYEGACEYSWRITTSGSEPIILTIDRAEIPVRSLDCYNYLSIYDGFNEEAPLLKRICGIQKSITVKTSSNIAFIKLSLDETNPGSLFIMHWKKSDDVAADIDNENDKLNCGFNSTKTILPGSDFEITSPNFPKDYDDNLNCEWIFKAIPGRHLSIKFNQLSIEEQSNCFADYISVFSSTDGAETWKSVAEKLCTGLPEYDLNFDTYMKVVFVTDISQTSRGFSAKVTSKCGGTVSSLSGVISPSWEDWNGEFNYIKTCNWRIKVRPGRTISLRFLDFNITNVNNNCENFVLYRNGDSEEAPILGNGKYCGFTRFNPLEKISSSSNAVFITFKFKGPKFQNFKLRYEEENIECGSTSILDFNQKWQVINSPNFPSVPTPYSECVWVFKCPPGEIIKIDFIERFDLERNKDCTEEYVEIRDGSSAMSPRKGRYCDERPGTIKTTNNAVYIKYTTQIPNPRDGFKANVSIDVCGGTIIANNGEISSPGYPHMTALPIGSVCEWKIIGYNGRVFKIRPQDIHLPDSESSCATKVTIEETLKVNNTSNILRTICNDDDDRDLSIVESTLNEVVIKLYIGKPSEYNSFSESRGFRFTFNSSRPTCGGSLTISEGYLMTPAYPLYTTLRYCQWLITAPNKSRRIRLEILDANFNLVKIGVFNDLRLQSSIKNTTEDNVFESSGNELAIYLWLFQSVTEHRFKAKFTSDEESLCGGSLSGTTGELFSPALERTYTCDWHYVNHRYIDNIHNSTINIDVTVNSSSTMTRCRYSDPKLIVKATIGPGLAFYRSLCGNMFQTYRIPSSNMDLRALQNEKSSLSFHVSWKTQPCGGTVHVTQSDQNILNLPNNYNGTLDCAWLVLVPFDSRVEMKLQGSFKLPCTKEFLQISQGLSDNPLILKEYCKDSMPETAFSVKFRFLYIQYHSESSNNDLKLLVSTKSSQCGGLLTKYENTFMSPNFPKNYIENQECVWEIKAEQGSRVSLQFVQRFVIEQRPNCTKDAVIIYDWKEGRYIQVAKLCGRELPHAYNSSGNRMKIVLRTDSDINLDGFKAVWTPICGSNLNASEEERFLYSPGYPFEYLPRLDCNYKISALGQKIILKYLDLEVEGPYPQCVYDNLTISGNTGNDGIVYDIFCGSMIYKKSEIFTDEVILEFKSDRYVQKKGFKLSYQIFSCGGEITTPTILKSHNDKDQYEPNLNCTWLITAPKDKDIVLKFLYIDLEDSSDCSTDFVAVYNGRNIDETRRTALMCGHVNSTTVIKGNGNTMVLNFLSDFGLSYTGFKVEILFSFNKEAGCGGLVNVMAEGTQTIKSPLIGSNLLYENFLNCHWDIKAPSNRVIMVEFSKFHIAPCKNINQTALGYSKCNCDMVEIRDGLNPNSLVIGTYCGHTLPPKLTSSGNFMSIRLYTDGEISSSGFEARVSVREPSCGQISYRLQSAVQTIKTPGFDKGVIPRGEHCVYLVYSVQALYLTSHIRIKYLDLQDGLQDKNVCDKDKLVITTLPSSFNDTLGKNFMLRRGGDEFFNNYYSLYQSDLDLPESFVFCGKKSSVDLYVTGDVKISVQTSPDSDNIIHKGVELEINYGNYCPRNFSDTQGRISVIPTIMSDRQSKECFTLITAPENHTISVYILSVSTSYWNDQVYFEILDGDKANDKRLLKISSDYEDNTSVFSTGRYLLLHNHGVEGDLLTYDLIFMTTDKGPGCGGKLHSILGQVTSPMYPDVYRRIATCEWELETPVGSKLHLHFEVFDLGKLCEQNYVQLVNRKGQVISSYCSEQPADYFSEDNYVKIVSKTTMNNAGSGWVAMFVGTK